MKVKSPSQEMDRSKEIIHNAGWKLSERKGGLNKKIQPMPNRNSRRKE